MDRYSSMEEYADAKRHILRNQKAGDIAFLNGGYPEVLGWASDTAADVYTYGTGGDDLDVCVRGGEVLFRGETIASVSRMRIGGRHNMENAAAAAAVCSRLGTARETIDEGLSSFSGVAHRFEYVARIGDITFYDDSAATTPPSVIAALGAAERPVALILGGYDKGLDVSSLIPACAANVAQVVLIGESTEALSRMFAEKAGGYAEKHVTRAGSMEEAVQKAAGSLEAGSVLLSPGYASFDMFRNYRERGARFKDAVQLYYNTTRS
jgi:UDP-N-acetylmuramoylalanine--D-glutamate ligase